MKTKCLIVDDEPLARELIRGHIQKLENFEIVAECDNAMKAMDALRNHAVDLMFLDIKMPQMSGIDFLKTLKRPPKVIITTAFSQYALDGFELDVVDYLMKPVTFERFFKSVNKYFQSGQSENVEVEGGNGTSEESFIYVKENKKVIKIYLREIHFIEGLNEYIRIHTDNRRVVVKSSLQGIENKLPSEQFAMSFTLHIDKKWVSPPASLILVYDEFDHGSEMGKQDFSSCITIPVHSPCFFLVALLQITG